MGATAGVVVVSKGSVFMTTPNGQIFFAGNPLGEMDGDVLVLLPSSDRVLSVGGNHVVSLDGVPIGRLPASAMVARSGDVTARGRVQWAGGALGDSWFGPDSTVAIDGGLGELPQEIRRVRPFGDDDDDDPVML